MSADACHLMFRKDYLVEGGSGILRSRLQSSVKWSDVSSLETELDNIILSSGRYMIKSSIYICLVLCVKQVHRGTILVFYSISMHR